MNEEKGFSAFIRSSKCAKWVAIIKLLVSSLLSITLIMVAIISSSAMVAIKKITSDKSSSTQFYVIFSLVVVFLILYAVCSFVLLIGTINRDRMKVLVFIIADCVLTLILLYDFVSLFPSILLIIFLPLQLFLFYVITMWMRELIREHNKRLEIKESRRKVEEAKVSYQREIEKYHANLKDEEENA